MYRASAKDGCVWITGASSGIGRALALRLAAQGFHVAATARRASALAALAAEGGGRIEPYPGDVTDAAAMAAIVEAIERVRPIALAVLNAGVYHIGDETSGFDAAKVWQTVEVNLGGTIRCLDPLLKAMGERGQGQIAIVASLAGYGGIPGSVAYGSAKSAMITMAEALRLTYAERGLTIQVVNPGFVATAMTAPNPYPMPFIMSADRAAGVICDGLQRGGFEISFPRRLVWPMKAAMLLPYGLWLPLMARATRRAKR
jgi:NAD(P)-dependent dehydrogenase (short-subunit alcohol dehydrogenase family)